MFRMIDATEKNEMHFQQLHEVIKWTLKGLGKFFANTVPRGRELQIVSYKAFMSADATNDNLIDYTELVNWIELNQQFITFLQEFEPSNPVQYDNKIYEGFYFINV